MLTGWLEDSDERAASKWTDQKAAYQARMSAWKQWHDQVTSDLEHIYVSLKTRSFEDDAFWMQEALPASGLVEVAPMESDSKDYWRTYFTGKRHTRDCPHYEKTFGRYCDATEGRPCKKCSSGSGPSDRQHVMK